MCVILEHASLLISLTVGLTELPSNGTKLLEGLRPSDFEEQNSEEEALKLIWVLTIDPSKHFRTPDARLNLNCLTLLPALPLPCVHVPGVVRGDLPVEESAGKVILSAQLEESGEGCVLWRALGNLLGVLWPEVNPLAVLKVDSELLDGRVTLVDWKTKDPPDRFLLLMYPPVWYILTSSLSVSAMLKTAISEPLLMYLQTYLMLFTEFANSTLMWALKVQERRGYMGLSTCFLSPFLEARHPWTLP